MAPSSMLMVLLAAAMIPGTRSDSQENELDYGYWNYREGGKSQRVGEPGNHRQKLLSGTVIVHVNMNMFNIITFAV